MELTLQTPWLDPLGCGERIQPLGLKRVFPFLLSKLLTAII